MRVFLPPVYGKVRPGHCPGWALPEAQGIRAMISGAVALAGRLLLAAALVGGVAAQETPEKKAAFATVFRSKTKSGAGVIQANFSEKRPTGEESKEDRLVAAALFGTRVENSGVLKLKFKAPEGYSIRVNPPMAVPAPDESIPTGNEVIEEASLAEGTNKWSWSGTIQIWPAETGGNFDKVKPIKITLQPPPQEGGALPPTVFEEVELLPADIWLAAGGSGWAERGEDPGGEGKLVQWEAFPNNALGQVQGTATPVIWMSTLDGTVSFSTAAEGTGEANLPAPSLAAAVFGREWQKRCGDKRPVVMLVYAAPRSLLRDWAKGAKEEEVPAQLAQAFWKSPTEMGANEDFGVSFRHRGLIWWHGAWDADHAADANEEAVAETDPRDAPKLRAGEGADDSLRARYARDVLNKVVKEWWASNTKGAEDHIKATQLLLVQPGPANHRPPHLDSFVRMWKEHGGSTHAAPVSTLAAIRFAIFDVARDIELKGQGKNTIYDFSKDITVVPRTGIFYPVSPASGAVLDAASTGRKLAELAHLQLSKPAAYPDVEKSGANFKLTGVATAVPAVVPALFFHPAPAEPENPKVTDPANFPKPVGAESIRTDASDGPRGPWPSLFEEGYAMPVFDLPLPP